MIQDAGGELHRRVSECGCGSKGVSAQCDLLAEDPYEDWIAARRERLAGRHLELLKRLAGLCEWGGDLTRSVDLF